MEKNMEHEMEPGLCFQKNNVPCRLRFSQPSWRDHGDYFDDDLWLSVS